MADLNYLYHRHQVSLFRSENAACAEARDAHHELALGYAARIADARPHTSNEAAQ